MAIKKPQTAYFLFSSEKRKQIVEENPGLRIGDIQKLITAQWKELTPEQKEVYLDLAAKDRERYEREKLANPELAERPSTVAATEGDDPHPNKCIYPLGRVKRIIQSDSDVSKVSRDALIAIAKASELFAQFLATKGYEQTLFHNKRQIKTTDIARAIQTTSVLDWLREDFPEVKATPAVTKASPGDTTKPTTTGSTAAAARAFFQPAPSTSTTNDHTPANAIAEDDELVLEARTDSHEAVEPVRVGREDESEGP